MASASTNDMNTIAVMAPKDADGRSVPLDTKVMYNASGDEFEVRWFTFSTGPYDPGWYVKVYDPSDGDSSDDRGYTIPLGSLNIEKPDSIKQLAEDLNRAWDVGNAQEKGCRYMSCYYDKDRGAHCNDCRLNSHGKMSCLDAMMADIVSRVNLLAGDSE